MIYLRRSVFTIKCCEWIATGPVCLSTVAVWLFRFVRSTKFWLNILFKDAGLLNRFLVLRFADKLMPFCNTAYLKQVAVASMLCRVFVNEHFSNDNSSVCTVFFCMTSAFGGLVLSKAPHCVMRTARFFFFKYGLPWNVHWLLRFNTFKKKNVQLNLCWMQSATTCNGKKKHC